MLLMEEAERIAREEHGSGKIAVISGNWGEAWGEGKVHDSFTLLTWFHN